MRLNKLFLILAGLAPTVAAADSNEASSYAWSDASLSSGYGVSTVLGGGVSGFTDATMRTATTSDVGGLWDLRVTIGSHTPIGVDLSYVGTAANIQSMTGMERTLVGSAFEGAVRYNVLPHSAVTPYAFVGIGYQRYDISGNTFTLSDTAMNQHDNVAIVPMGAGLSFRDAGWVAELRGTFRAAASSEVVLDKVGGSKFAPMHSWATTAALGYEF
ncbi:MAG: hypothetical protein NT062_32210 [Proteobacteria bacterium]|nr:hypothetical protein [Pseudomonadota bacterium]